MIDFSPLDNNEMKLLAFAAQYTIDDLRRATNESIDYLLKLIEDLTDEDVVFEPIDPDANDPYAAEGEQHIGWNIAHLIAHVTASSEEGAAFSSLLARGIPAQERPRYETPWRDITTKAQCVQRLEESRRIRLAYLDTWPDDPFLDVYRQVSERFIEKFGQMNAPAAFLFGLWHEVGHYDQIKEVIQQAKQAKAQNI
ncbi:MAG: hypothetical protein Kow00117_09460 [Phototrophicales bacterium]